MKRFIALCLALIMLGVSVPVCAVEVPGGYTEDDYYVDSWRYSEQGTDGRLSFWLGDHQETQLKATSSMMTMQADEEHPWEEGAGITVDLTSGLEALFKSITIELAIMDGAPETWKLQVSTDGGATYTDIEGAVATIQEKGETEVLFKRIQLPEPFDYSEYLENKSEYVPEEHHYRIRMVAVSEEGTEAWVGNTSGEVYIREVCLEESIALPCVEVPGGYTEDDYYVDSWRYSEQGTDGRLSFWLGDHQETQLKATSSMMTMQADEKHPWEEGAGITVDLTSGLEALFKSITIEVAIMDGAPETWKLQVSTDGGATYADIEGAVATIQEKGETEVLFKRIHLPEPFAYSEYLEHKSEYVPEEHPYRIRMVAVSEEGTKAWVGNTSGEVYIKEVCLEDQVKLPATDDISVSSISVSLDKNLLIRSEEFVQATAEVLPDDANNKEVVWSVSDENVARVDENGKVTRIDRKFTMDSIVSHVVEEVSVIATAADGSGVVGSAVLKVENEGYPLLPYITLDDAQKKANEIYESGQGNYTDESWQAFESAREALNHCEYDGAKLIACIEELEKAEAGLTESELETETESETEVKESETSTQTEKQSESKLEPAKQKVTTIQAAKKITLKKGKTKKLKVAVKNRNGKKITFRSRNPKIAKVSKNGLVTGKKKGTTKILIQCNGKKKTVTVKVK